MLLPPTKSPSDHDHRDSGLLGLCDHVRGTARARERDPRFQDFGPRYEGIGGLTFNGWDQDSRQLRRRKDGVWWTNLRLAPGTYEYKFVIDDQHWQEDPDNPQRVLNDHGTFNSVREVS